MLRKTMTCALILVILATCQVHLALLQMVAWSKMLYDYSQENVMTEAVSMTFSGEYPCEMCMSIRASQTVQDEQPSIASLWFSPFLLCISVNNLRLFRPRVRAQLLSIRQELAQSRRIKPATPPPKA